MTVNVLVAKLTSHRRTLLYGVWFITWTLIQLFLATGWVLTRGWALNLINTVNKYRSKC